MLKILKTPTASLKGVSQDRNLGAIVSLAYKNNPTAFTRENSGKIKYIENPWAGFTQVIGSGAKFISKKRAETRFKLLLGEHKAGNNSKILKRELKDLGDLLHLNGGLSKGANLKVQRL